MTTVANCNIVSFIIIPLSLLFEKTKSYQGNIDDAVVFQQSVKKCLYPTIGLVWVALLGVVELMGVIRQ